VSHDFKLARIFYLTSAS